MDNLGSSNKGLNEKPKKLEQSESFDSQMVKVGLRNTEEWTVQSLVI